MKTLLAVAVMVTFGTIAFTSANAAETRSADQLLDSAPDRVDPVSKRVSMAFSLRGSIGRQAPAEAQRPAPAPQPATASETATPATPWYGLDRSLQKGDIVVTETGALVYEGEKAGKRHFRTVGLSRLVNKAESERILESVKR